MVFKSFLHLSDAISLVTVFDPRVIYDAPGTKSPRHLCIFVSAAGIISEVIVDLVESIATLTLGTFAGRLELEEIKE